MLKIKLAEARMATFTQVTFIFSQENLGINTETNQAVAIKMVQNLVGVITL